MKTLKVLAIVFGMTFLYSSCAKDGATGPAGPTGPTGIGAAGPTGPMGNANVKDSTFTFLPGAWLSVSAYEYVNISDPEITSNIISNGTVLVFWSINGTSWDALNFSSENPTGYILDYNISLGSLLIAFSGGGNPNSVFGGTQSYFKVVCMTSQAIKQHPNTDWKNYSQVKAIIDAQNSLKN